MLRILLLLILAVPASAQGTTSFYENFKTLGTERFENPNQERPMNIILLWVDDIGKEQWRSKEETGSGETEIPATPNLDSLRTQGITFINAYTNPLCAPSHRSLVTGRYGFRYQGGGPGVATSTYELTLAEAVRYSKQSYRTAWFGKFNHRCITTDGNCGGGTVAQSSALHGWEYFSGFQGPSISDYESWSNQIVHGYRNGQLLDEGSSSNTNYITGDIFSQAIAWLATIGEDPFVLVISANASHFPFHEANSGDGQNCILVGGNDECVKTMTEYWDAQIPALLAAVDTTYTYVIFMSDDGDALRFQTATCTAGKGSLEECGSNVGLVISYGDVPVSLRNTEESSLVHVADLFATIVDITGAVGLPTRVPQNPLDARYNGQKRIQDGLSLQSFWTAGNRCSGYEYCWHRDGGSTRVLHAGNGSSGFIRAVRDADFKYVLNPDDTTDSCYDMNPPDDTVTVALSNCDALKASMAALEATGS